MTFTIDATAPDAPVITAPAAGAVLTDSTPAIMGTAEPGAEVEVSVDGNVIGTVTAGPGGAWGITSPLLANGPHTASATATDAAGNTSPATSVTFSIDSTVPAAPTITAPANDASIANNTPTIMGTAEPGTEVEVSIDGTVIGTTTVGADGTWSLDVVTPLEEGLREATATSTNAAGNTSPAESVTFTIDTIAPAPVIENPADGAFTSVRQPNISGTSEPGSTVEVTLLDAQGNIIETFTVTAQPGDGSWSVQPTDPLGDGVYTIEVEATDAAGNTGGDSSSFTVDATAVPIEITSPAAGDALNDAEPFINGTTAPNAEVSITITNAEGDVVTTLSATADENGDWRVQSDVILVEGAYTATATTENEAGLTSSSAVGFTVDLTAPVTVITSPADGDTLDTALPMLTGTSEPGATITILVDGESVGSTTADENGDWSFALPTPLGEGEHTFTAESVDEAGNIGDPVEITVTIDTSAEVTVELTSPTPGEEVTTDTVTVTGTATPGARVEIFVDGVKVGEVTADPDGDWSFTFTPEEGVRSVKAVATIGDQTVESPEISFTFAPDKTTPDPRLDYLSGGGCTQSPAAPQPLGLLAVLGAMAVALLRRHRKT